MLPPWSVQLREDDVPLGVEHCFVPAAWAMMPGGFGLAGVLFAQSTQRFRPHRSIGPSDDASSDQRLAVPLPVL
jgi:hypothetical protein